MIFDPNTNEYVDNIDLSFDEPLNEANISIDYNNGLRIDIFPRTNHLVGYLNDPYFKVYNNSSMTSAKNVARISMLEPRYIHHSDPNGKKDFRLSAHQKTIIVAMLKRPAVIERKRYNSAWEGMCRYLENLAKSYTIINVDYDNLIYHMPDYTKL